MRRHYPNFQRRAFAARTAGQVYTGVKRAATYLAGPKKKARVNPPMAGGQQAQYSVYRKKNYGKKKSFRARQNALVTGNSQNQIWRWQRLSSFAVTGGGINCGYSFNNLVPPTGPSTRYPLYLFDLESLENINNGVNRRPPVCYRLCALNNAPATKMYFDVVTTPDVLSQTNAGTTGLNQWYPENISGQTTAGTVIAERRILQDFVSAKMIFYGATQYPTKFIVQVVKFKDDWLHPDWWGNNATAITDPVNNTNPAINLSTHRNVFWQSMLVPLISNPLNSQDKNMASRMTVVRTICSVMIEPKDTDEVLPTTNPHMIRQDAYLRYDKVLKFDWNDTIVSGASNLNIEGYPSTLGDTKNTTPPKTRTYLMIRAQVAQSRDATVTPAYDPLVDPSFDIVLRKSVTSLG